MTARRRPAVAAAVLTLGLALPASGLAAGRILHHDLTVRLDVPGHGFAAEDHMRVAGSGAVDLGLAPGLAVTALRVDGLARRADGRKVDLGAPGEHRVVLGYGGELPPAGPGGLVIDAAGSFLAPGTGWYPRLDETTFTYRVAVETAAPGRAVVAGRLVAESTAGGVNRAVFAADYPADGMVLAAGDWAVAERLHQGIRLRTYFDPSIAGLAEGYLVEAAAAISRFSGRIGAYPYASFFMVSGPFPVGLGFAGLTYMGARVLALPFIRHRSLVHEVLHCWWGNGVFVDAAGGNWAEGLTTYLADHDGAEARRSGAGRDMRLAWLRDYAALPPGRDRPAAAFTAKHHDAAQVIGYGKVAYVFHMLRGEIGDAAFDGGLHRLWRDHRFRAAGWPDLRRAFEAAAGRDLGAFFDQWLRRRGAPRLRLGRVTVDQDDGAYRIRFALTQEAPAYALAVPVAVATTGGEVRARLALAGDGDERLVTTRARPLSLAVDPDFDLFRRLDPAEAPPILRDVTLDGATTTIVLDHEEAARAAARRLAARLLDTPPRFARAAPTGRPETPLLVIGSGARVAAFLAAAGLPGVPAAIAGRGTARAWALRSHGVAVVAVAADDAAALAALIRPLPHYGAKGYVVAEGGRVVAHGRWPVGPRPLRVRLD